MATDMTRIVRLGVDARGAESGARKASRALRDVGDSSDRASKDLREFDDSQKKAGKGANALAGALKTLVAGFTATLIVRQVVRDIIEFEKGLAGVGKTTGISGRELQGLGQSFIELSLRSQSSTSQLLEIGQAAGQLGVTGTENILKFTDVIAKLGGASNLAGEEAATVLARILNVTNENVDSVDRLASVTVRLGNNVAATEAEIAQTTQSVAQATAIYEIGSTRASAFGAALASLGVRAELGGSSIGRLFRTIDSAVRGGGDQLEVLSALIGQSPEQLGDAFRSDPTQVVRQFLSGLGEVVKSGDDAVKVLEALGLQGEEVLKVIPTLAVNSERLSQAFKLAVDEAANVTALEEEAQAAAQTVSAELTKLDNTLRAVRLSLLESRGPISDFIKSLRGGIAILMGFELSASETSDSAERTARILKALAIVLTAGVLPGLIAVIAKLPILATQLTGAGVAAAGLTTGLVSALAAMTALVAFDLGTWLYESFEPIRKLGDEVAAALQIAFSDIEYYFDVLLVELEKKLNDFLSGVVAAPLAKIASSDILPDSVRGVLGGALATAAASRTVGDSSYQAGLEKARADRTQREQLIGAALGMADSEREADFSLAGQRDATTYLESFGEGIEKYLVGPLGRSLSNMNAQLGEQAKQGAEDLANFAPGVEDAGDAAAQANPNLEKLRELIQSVGDSAESGKSRVVDFFESLRIESQLQALSGDQRERAIQLRELETTLMKLTTDELRSINEQVINGSKVSDTVGDPERIALTNALLAEAKSRLDDLAAAERIERIAEGIGEAFGDAFASAISGAESLGDALEGLFEQLIRVGTTEFITSFITQQATNFAGLFTPSAKGNYFENGTIVPFASGGIVDSKVIFPMRDGKIGMAGERGAEAYATPQRLPNGDMGFAMHGGGGVRTQINNFNMIVERDDEFGLTQSQAMTAFRPVTNKLRGR